MPNITGHTELVGLMAYPIRHSRSPQTHGIAYDRLGIDAVQLAFEVTQDSLEDAVKSIRALKMLGSNISMPNKTVVHKYLDDLDDTARLCGAVNTVVNVRDKNGNVTGFLKGYNTDGMGYWHALNGEGIDYRGMRLVIIGTGGAAAAIAVFGAINGISRIDIFNIKDDFYGRGEELASGINSNTGCVAEMHDLADKDILYTLMHSADIFCDATGVGMHPLENESNVPDCSYFHKDLIVTDTVYEPLETVMMGMAREAGCKRVYNGIGMMIYQAITAIELYTGKKVSAEYMKEKLDMGNDIIFRKAKTEDLDELADVYSAVVRNMNENGIFQWNSEYPNREVMQDDISKGQLYVGEVNGKIVSAYSLNKMSDDTNHVAKWTRPEIDFRIIHRLCVDPRIQSRGFATRTIRHIEADLLANGIMAIRLDTVSQNVPAVNLYKKLGYEIVGEDEWQSGKVYFFEKYL